MVGVRADPLPMKTVLIKLDHHLRTDNVSTAGVDQVADGAPTPLHQEHELSRDVCGADDAISGQATVEASELLPGGGLGSVVGGRHGGAEYHRGYNNKVSM